MSASHDATAKLVQLGKAKSFCALDYYNCGIWDIDSDFDYGSGTEDGDLSGLEIAHDGIFLGWFHLAVQDADLEMREDRLFQPPSLLLYGLCYDRRLFIRIRLVDSGTDHI